MEDKCNDKSSFATQNALLRMSFATYKKEDGTQNNSRGSWDSGMGGEACLQQKVWVEDTCEWMFVSV